MKTTKFLLVITAFILLNINVVCSQELAKHRPVITSQLGNSSVVLLYTYNSKFKLESEKSIDNDFELESAESIAYDSAAKKEFGSYVNPHSNYLKIVSKDKVEYTKAQLTNVETGKKVFSKKLGKDNNSIDLSAIPSGKYLLIMTDEGMNIFSEELTIF